MKIIKTHISQIKNGDIIKHNDKIMTVCSNNIKRDNFMGITIFGDSYRLGIRPVKKVIL